MEEFDLKFKFPVTPLKLYESWLNSEKHSEFTGGLAAIEEKLESRYTAWDGYITGKILEFDHGKRVLHTWRTSEFPDGAEDSMLELTFCDDEAGCLLKLKHWNIPVNQGARYLAGWYEHYFNPMTEYFKRV